jgi:hypothetical protein
MIPLSEIIVLFPDLKPPARNYRPCVERSCCDPRRDSTIYINCTMVEAVKMATNDSSSPFTGYEQSTKKGQKIGYI